MIVLDYRDRRPLYEQVTERLQELMFQGVLPEDTQLPSVRSLATELSINPNTIQRAYGELERQGYIYSVKGKGSFVADRFRIRVRMKEEWEKHFDQAAESGFHMGVGLEEMKERLEKLAEKKMEPEKEPEKEQEKVQEKKTEAGRGGGRRD